MLPTTKTFFKVIFVYDANNSGGGKSDWREFISVFDAADSTELDNKITDKIKTLPLQSLKIKDINKM